MKQFALKRKSIIQAILTPTVFVPSVLTSCLLGVSPMTAYAEHLDLPSVDVVAHPLANEQADSVNTSDTASLLLNGPGVSLYRAGGVSSLPVIHGLADDRIRIKVDGMDLISSCANHMNPALSYIDPANVNAIQVLAGITPVSMGGDSIAGTIVVDSKSPEFAEAGHGLLVEGKINTFYRSNNNARGVNLSSSVANEQMYMRYTGSTVEANNYQAGGKFKTAGRSAILRGWLGGGEVGSTAYESRNHALAFGLQHENHLLEFKLGLQDIPYQGFVNQRMDMTGNKSEQYNLSYKGKYDWGKLEARTYHERTRHSMQFGKDKQYWYGSGAMGAAPYDVPGMPMDTEGRTTGFVLKGDINLSQRDILRVGTELQRYRLDDWWDPSQSPLTPVGTNTMMGPNAFLNINRGQRDRYDVFAEWDAKWNEQWFSQLGLRSSFVKMDAGTVVGYNNAVTIPMGMMTMPGYKPAADAFNAADRSKTDNNINVTAFTRFTPDAEKTFEAGYAMKTRSPNVYERFAWSNTNTMVMNMNNLYGDGNGYVGNLNLKPEIVHKVSVSGHWHDAGQQHWYLKVTPHFTYVDGYIDAVACAQVGKTCNTRTDGFTNLSLDNQSARIYGLDVSGKMLLAQNTGVGRFDAMASVSYLRGKNNTSDDNLYNIMPLNAKLALEHQFGQWSNKFQAKIVDSKNEVQAVRKEFKTAGYTLFDFYTSYEWKQARLDLGVENIFDKLYYDPLGGAYLGQGATMGTTVTRGLSVPGMGRSINVGLTLKY